MSIVTRLNKLEQYLKPNGKETDFSNVTDEELDILIRAYENNTQHLPEAQSIYNKINWGEDPEINSMTLEEIEAELKKYEK